MKPLTEPTGTEWASSSAQTLPLLFQSLPTISLPPLLSHVVPQQNLSLTAGKEFSFSEIDTEADAHLVSHCPFYHFPADRVL